MKPYLATGAELLVAANSARAGRDDAFLHADPKATLLRPCAPWLVPCQAAGNAAVFDTTLNSMADRPPARRCSLESGIGIFGFQNQACRAGRKGAGEVGACERERERSEMVGGAK